MGGTRGGRKEGCKGKSLHMVDGMSLSEVAEKLGYSYSMCYEMHKKGFDTVYTMKKYREAIATGEVYKRGAVSHLTSRGSLTVDECVDLNEHGISRGALEYRGHIWGWNHRCLWMPQMQPRAFRAAAIALDGPPRGRAKPRQRIVIKPVLIDRFLVCHRDKGMEICKHYDERMHTDHGLPKQCEKYGTSCCNYAGIRNDVTSKPMSTVAWCE